MPGRDFDVPIRPDHEQPRGRSSPARNCKRRCWACRPRVDLRVRERAGAHRPRAAGTNSSLRRVGSARFPSRRVRDRWGRQQLPELGQELPDLAAGACELLAEHAPVHAAAIRANRLDPGPVRGRTSGFPAAAPEHHRVKHPGALTQLSHQTALPDARFAAHHQEPALAQGRCLEGSLEAFRVRASCRRTAFPRGPASPGPQQTSPPAPAPAPSSAGSCSRIAVSSSRSLRPGSIPSSSGEHATHLRARIQSLGLTPAAVKGEHELLPRSLPQRVLKHDLFKRADRLGIRPSSRSAWI